MSTKLSVAEILAKLEERVRFHREKAAFHVEQEAFHREQGAHHAAELEKVTARYGAFQASAGDAVDLAQELAIPPAAPKAPEERDGRVFKSRLIVRVVESLEKDRPFGASEVTSEVNRRYRERLRQPVDNRAASTVLRRLRDAGRIREVQKGRAFQEARYTR